MTEPNPKLTAAHPIVLIPGAMGCLHFEGAVIRCDYFRGVRHLLEALGNRVHFLKLPTLATVPQRAALLLEWLRPRAGEGPFNIVAHSMGGFDARHLISTLRAGDLVASLTMIATPHRGAEAAHWRNRLLGRLGIMPSLCRRRPAVAEHFETFTREWAERFNETNPDAPHVRYRCWAGVTSPWSAAPILQPLWPMIHAAEGPHDGLVSVQSARGCDAHFAGVIAADHFAQLGWKLGLNRFDRFDHRDFYRAIVRELAEAGL